VSAVAPAAVPLSLSFSLPLQAPTQETAGSGGAPIPEFVREFQALFPTTESRIVGTVIVVVALLGAVGLIRVSTVPFRERFTPQDVEAVEATLFTLASTVAAALLVVIWGAVGLIWDGLRSVILTPRQGALVLIAALSFVVAFTVSQISEGLLRGRGDDLIDRHRQEAIHHVVQIVVYLGAAAFVLAMAGVDPGNLIVGAGAAGIVLGLAARQTIGAVFAGFVVLLSRPFEVGDWVEIDGEEGIVTDVTLFNTRLRTFADEHVVVPNDEVTASNILNRSAEGQLRVSVDVGVDYDTDVQRAARLAREAMESVDEVMAPPHPHVVMKEFGSSAVVLQCRFWIDDPTARRRWAARSSVIDAVKRTFESEGVRIPFPQRELSGRGEAGLALDPGEPIATPPGAASRSRSDDAGGAE